MSSETIIVWFREDLRLDDNPAFFNACQQARYIIPVYTFDDKNTGNWPLGSASRWWLERSLACLQNELKTHQSDLLIFKGDCAEVLNRIIKSSGTDSVYWNRLYAPARIERDKKIKTRLKASGVEAISHEGNLLIEPWKILNKSDGPYKVFTPYWKRVKEELINQPPTVYDFAATVPPLPKQLPESLSIESLKLYVSKVDWARDFSNYWQPGMNGAEKIKNAFMDQEIYEYSDQRDMPDIDGTSRLSPHLHFGEFSVKKLWLQIYQSMQTQSSQNKEQSWSYLRQLVWRDFSQYLLFHFPHIDQKPFRPEFAEFPWQQDQTLLEKWQQGQTGYPLVDAGMRQLWQTGWMHNRVRMVCASFLTKHLLIHWHQGAKWFWDTLVDADLANNSCGWQWVAGSGADAAPYFRIFNPITQSKKFDPQGHYIRRWVPELAKLDAKFIHEPWLADETMLNQAGVELSQNYPHIIIQHAFARQRALDCYAQMRNQIK